MPALPPENPASAAGGEHLRGHAHLTNCIHLRHHHAHGTGASGRRRSPPGGGESSASTALMRDLLAMQRSRSLRDPSSLRSVDSSSNRVATDPDAADRGSALKTLLDQLVEDARPRPWPRLNRRRGHMNVQ